MTENGDSAYSLKKWALGSLALGALVFFVFIYLGDIGRGRIAAISFYVLALNVGVFWRWKRKVLFWIMILIFTLGHALLILFIEWPSRDLPGRALLPLGALDFFVIFGTVSAIQRVWESKTES